MIILVAGASHTGKTALAQRLLKRYHYPVLSLDLLKMGLIRSGQTSLTPEDDELLIPYVWSIASEMIKTAIENDQNLIVEGCYIPFDWQESFSPSYLAHINYWCLVMSEPYIRNHASTIRAHANVAKKGCMAKSTSKNLSAIIYSPSRNASAALCHTVSWKTTTTPKNGALPRSRAKTHARPPFSSAQPCTPSTRATTRPNR